MGRTAMVKAVPTRADTPGVDDRPDGWSDDESSRT
jgi:hypothetical protein